jgi:Fic family protein
MSNLTPDVTQNISIVGQLPGFLVGVISSACIAIPLYLKQKRDAAESERRIILAIHQQQRQDAGLAPLIASTMGELSGKQEELLSQFEDLKKQFAKVVKNAHYERALPLSQPYTAVARALAAENAQRALYKEPENLELSEDTLRQLHASLFPAKYELAGRLRDLPVWIGPVGSTPDKATFTPVPADQVATQLSELLQGWNSNLADLKAGSPEQQLREIARFHHRFVSIHPFLDGNGILARLLTSRQLQSLLGVEGHLIERDADYIAALRMADSGDLDPLCQYLKEATG